MIMFLLSLWLLSADYQSTRQYRFVNFVVHLNLYRFMTTYLLTLLRNITVNIIVNTEATNVLYQMTILVLVFVLTFYNCVMIHKLFTKIDNCLESTKLIICIYILYCLDVFSLCYEMMANCACNGAI